MKTISSIFIYLGFAMIVITGLWKFLIEWNGWLAFSAFGCLIISILAEVRDEINERKKMKRRIRL